MPRHPASVLAAFAAVVVVLGGCGSDAGPPGEPGVTAEQSAPTLGPADGAELPGEALDRVAVGDLAPDFTLASLSGTPVTLSDYRGSKTVLLVFYRGHW